MNIRSSIDQAARVVLAIAVIKWVVALSMIAYGILGAVVIETSTTWPRVFEFATVANGLLLALGAWAFFGWLQHVLGQLALSNKNTESFRRGGLVINTTGKGVSTGGSADPLTTRLDSYRERS